jgi:hypothetical protein
MPSDFFIYRKICFEYKKGDKYDLKEHILENSKEGFEWWDIEMEEEEELVDFYERLENAKMYQIFTEIEKNPKVEVYKNRAWLCSELSKENYLAIAKSLQIPVADLVSVWKESDYYVK